MFAVAIFWIDFILQITNLFIKKQNIMKNLVILKSNILNFLIFISIIMISFSCEKFEINDKINKENFSLKTEEVILAPVRNYDVWLCALDYIWYPPCNCYLPIVGYKCVAQNPNGDCNRYIPDCTSFGGETLFLHDFNCVECLSDFINKGTIPEDGIPIDEKTIKENMHIFGPLYEQGILGILVKD